MRKLSCFIPRDNDSLSVVNIPKLLAFYKVSSVYELTCKQYADICLRLAEQNEKIDLLRNTSLSIFKESLLGEMLSGFNADSNQDMNLGELETTVQGPALLIIPIAIYL